MNHKWIYSVRWTARVWSIASLGLILLFIIGEGINPTMAREWVGLLFFPLGISIGMVVAWWREALGGIITAASLLIFYVFHFATTGRFPTGWAWLAFTAPGILFILSSYLSRRANSEGTRAD
jgi:hypothetical protein